MKRKNILLALVLIFSGCATDKISASESPSLIDKNRDRKEYTPNIPKIKIKTLEEKIGSMLMVGFMGTTAHKNSQICKDISKYSLAGVIIFDVNPTNKHRPKNIVNPNQVAELTKQLQSCSHDKKLLIAVDQEGGRVQRLKRKYGFYGKFPKAKDVQKKSDIQVRTDYFKMAEELNSVGINFNLAPVVDLSINKRNRVIYKLGRSFGSNPRDVAKYSSIFMDAMRSNGVLTSLKHFPGHGSSLGDTHKGFVDVTKLWKKKELEPYRLLTKKDDIDTVMVAHVFNRRIDAKYPATLSKKTINGLLRADIGFDGVVITDDLQMGAITKKYGLKNRLKLAIGAGNDILLFGNQLSVKSMVRTKNLVDIVRNMVKSGEVDIKDIEKSNKRIEILKKKI